MQIETLQAALDAETKALENPTVVLRVDKTLPVDNLVQVVDVVNKSHIPLVLATDKGK